MMFQLLAAMLFAASSAIRVHDEEGADSLDSLTSSSSVLTDRVDDMMAGAVLRERYVLKERLEKQVPGREFPPTKRLEVVGTAEHLGSGSFGDTWKAYDAKLGKEVAVKIFFDRAKRRYMWWQNATAQQREELMHSVEECKRVQGWMQSSAGQLGANRICQCYEEHITDQGNTDWYMFLVMELCGKDLDTELSRRRQFMRTEIKKSREWTRQIVEGIHFITSLTPGWMHHDLKPANVAVNAAGQIKLIDWGGALEGRRENFDANCVRTPAYAPPEMNEGNVCFSFPVHTYDVYAAGLLYMQFLCPRVNAEMWIHQDARNLLVPTFATDIDIYAMLVDKCEQLRGQIRQDLAIIAKMVSRSPLDRRPLPSCCRSYVLSATSQGKDSTVQDKQQGSKLCCLSGKACHG